MILHVRAFKDTKSLIQNDKKRTFEEMDRMTVFVNSQMKINKHEFLKNAKVIIYKNFPGISLESERMFGKFPNEYMTIRAKRDTIGRTCPLSVRQHSKNSVYFCLNPQKQSVVVKCFKCEGFLQLEEDGSILSEIRNNVVISEKESKKVKTTEARTLQNLDEIEIIKFAHDVVHVDEAFIREFYDLNFFCQVPARLDKKAPTFKDWNSRTFEMNESINFEYNNIAICTGIVSGIFCVDVDVSENGLIYFQKLCTKNNYRYDNETTCILTPSGGIHLYFQYDEIFFSNSVGLRTVDSLGNPSKISIDIRSNGGCVIAPPSKYSNGQYRFLCMKRPQKCPDFIYELSS
jgi:hypothetical protein